MVWAFASSAPILKPLVAPQGLASLHTPQALWRSSNSGEAASESHNSEPDPCSHRLDLSHPEVLSEIDPAITG